MAWGLSATTRNNMANAFRDSIDAGSGAGVLEIRTGSKPANADAADSGTLLATVAFADPSTGSASSGTVTVTDPAAVTGVAAGTAGHARIKTSAGGVVADGTVTATGGGGDVTLATTTISVGLSVDITSGGSFTMPAGG